MSESITKFESKRGTDIVTLDSVDAAARDFVDYLHKPGIFTRDCGWFAKTGQTTESSGTVDRGPGDAAPAVPA